MEHLIFDSRLTVALGFQDERQKLFTQLQELEKQEKEVQGKEKELDKEEKVSNAF